MSSPLPKSPYLKAGTYDQEPSQFGDMNNLMRFFMTKAMRASLTSPPLAKDVGELTLVYDKTLDRIYTKSNGTLRFIQFT